MEPCPIHGAMQWSGSGTRTFWGGGLVPQRALIIRQFHQAVFVTWTYFPFRRNSMKSSILAMSSIACVRQVTIYKTKMVRFYFDLTAHFSQSSTYWNAHFHWLMHPAYQRFHSFLLLVRVELGCTGPVCLHFGKLSFKSIVINVQTG